MKITTYTTVDVTFRNTRGYDDEISSRCKEIYDYEYKDNLQIKDLYNDAVRRFEGEALWLYGDYGEPYKNSIRLMGSDSLSCFLYAEKYVLFFYFRVTIT